MKTAFKRGLLSVALASVSMGTAFATPITYTFNGTSGPYTTYTQLDAVSNETVTVTASSTDGPSQVSLNGNPGLGVRQVQGGGSNTIDANGSRTEALRFSFDQLFSLSSFALSSAGPSDSFILSWGTGAQTTGSESLLPIGSTSVNPYLVLASAVGDWFQISATRNGTTGSTFYIQNLTVDTATAGAPRALPEPGSLLLASLGLSGLALLRRRGA